MNNYPIDTPLIEFTDGREPASISLREACNIFVVGATNSGKSSGSARYLILNMLRNGCGGLVLCVKNERETWEEYCRITGREDDLLILKPGGEHAFDFLAYESSRSAETTFVSNLTALLNSVIQQDKEKKDGRSDDPFWSNSLSLLMHSCIGLILLGESKLTLPLLYDVVLSIKSKEPDSAFNKALNKAKQKVLDKIEPWAIEVGREYLMQLSDEQYNQELFCAVPAARELRLIDQFFTENYKKLSEKTRSIVELYFINFLFSLLQEPVYSLFSGGNPSTFSPESSYLDKKIILLDIPTKVYGQAGQFAQQIFKSLWQRAMERRDTKANNTPVFLVSDECQEMVSEGDNLFLATARSSFVTTLYITQNLPGLKVALGGTQAENRMNNLLGNFTTKIIHANTDVETCSWAESLIGQAFQADESTTVTTTNGTTSNAKAISVKLASMVRKESFAALKAGGAPDYKVSAYIHMQGRKFSSGFSHTLLHFNQRYTPKQNSFISKSKN